MSATLDTLHDRAAALARRVSSAFNAEMETRIAEAHAAGMNLAVSEIETDTTDARAWYVQLEPGQMPPQDGRAWTVYHSSGDVA